MTRRFLRSMMMARMALFAMLCQALLPTIAYHQASASQDALRQVARAFGAGAATAAVHASHHHVDGKDGAAAQPHDHGIHCALCLADLMPAAMPGFYFPPVCVATDAPRHLCSFAVAIPPSARKTPRARDPPAA